MIRVVPSFLCFLCAFILCEPLVAHAQKLDELGRNGAWTAYTFKDNGKKICYMASAPEKSAGKYKQRGEPYALVTNRTTAGSKGEVNFVAGYTFRKEAPVKVSIDKKSFELFTTGDRAWSPDVAMDNALVKAMIQGTKMVVRGISSRGTKTTDTYSLSGFKATLTVIDKACGTR